jgi:transcriptional regulator with XRE-family HTH domain
MYPLKSGCRVRREAANMSRERLANHPDVRCSTSTIANVERGQRCSDALAQRIAGVLGCDPEELFEVVVLKMQR